MRSRQSVTRELGMPAIFRILSGLYIRAPENGNKARKSVTSTRIDILFVIVTGCCRVAFQNPIGPTIQTASRRTFRKDLTRAESPTKPAKRVPVSTGVWCRCSHLASISDVGHRRPSVGELWPRIEGNHSAPCVKVLWRLLVRRALTYRFSAA